MRKQKIAIVGADLVGVYAAYRLGDRIHSIEVGLDLGPT